MNANEVNTVVDNICTKIGIADGSAQNLWQELPKYILCNDVSYLLFSIAAVAIFIAVFLFCKRKWKDDDEDECAVVMMGVSIVVILIFVVVMVDAAIGIISCINAPNATTFNYIIRMFK